MNLVRDISATFWAASVGNDTNWRANHAVAALFALLLFLVLAGWSAMFSGHPQSTKLALLSLGGAIASFGLWRYLLPAAVHRANIQKILYAANPKQNKSSPKKNT